MKNCTIDQTLPTYLDKEFDAIKANPTYADYHKKGYLVIFEKEKLFHMEHYLPGFNEWRILNYIRLKLANTANKEIRGITAYLDGEFDTIKDEPSYKKDINSGKLKVYDGAKLFHMTAPLGDWREFRILSYNQLRSRLVAPSCHTEDLGHGIPATEDLGHGIPATEDLVHRIRISEPGSGTEDLVYRINV